MMWKAWTLTALLSVILTLLIGQKSFSYPMAQLPKPGAQNLAPTEEKNLTIDEPVCYVQTEDGRMIDISKLCIQKPSSLANQNTNNGYNFAAMKKFDDELYGAGN